MKLLSTSLLLLTSFTASFAQASDPRCEFLADNVLKIDMQDLAISAPVKEEFKMYSLAYSLCDINDEALEFLTSYRVEYTPYKFSTISFFYGPNKSLYQEIKTSDNAIRKRDTFDFNRGSANFGTIWVEGDIDLHNVMFVSAMSFKPEDKEDKDEQDDGMRRNRGPRAEIECKKESRSRYVLDFKGNMYGNSHIDRIDLRELLLDTCQIKNKKKLQYLKKTIVFAEKQNEYSDVKLWIAGDEFKMSDFIDVWNSEFFVSHEIDFMPPSYDSKIMLQTSGGDIYIDSVEVIFDLPSKRR